MWGFYFLMFFVHAQCQFIVQPSNEANQFIPPSSNEAPLVGVPNTGGVVPNVAIPNPVGVVPHVSIALLGQTCVDSFSCSGIPNAHCALNHTCQCLPNFMEDPIFAGTCRLAPGYNEACNRGELQCRTPFVCNKSSLCDCPDGFIQEFFQCIKDCPKGEIPIADKCYPARQLEEKCEKNEQCVQTYAQCLHNKCQCIQGANHVKGECVPVSQCPIGDPLKYDNSSLVTKCSIDATGGHTCPTDYYCLQADASETSGFCCPKIKMNCPIGQPLEGYNCTTCPWETHHCFSYVIGRFTDTMCCPNACPTSHPIQKDGRCYARSAFEGHCDVDEQCYNVLNAVCRKDSNDVTKCLCPKGNYRFYFGRCVRESNLGDQCDVNEDCKIGTGTQCLNNVCACIEGQIPEPVKNPKTETPQKCIGEPTCPTFRGREKAHYFTDCSFDSGLCKDSETCRTWWAAGNTTYSLCCKKPIRDDYDAICTPYNMKVSLVGSLPRRCDILPFTQNFFLNDAIKRNDGPETCAVGSSCLFDPFEINKGICCEPDVHAPTLSTTHQTTNKQQSSSSTKEKEIEGQTTTATLPSSVSHETTTTEANKAEKQAIEKPVKSQSINLLRHNNPIRVITADNVNRIPIHKPSNDFTN